MKKLLQLLEDDCTLTTGQLASMAGMTEEEAKAAIRKYEEEKVILGYKAIVDWDRDRPGVGHRTHRGEGDPTAGRGL